MLLTSITSEITECSPGFQNRIMDAQQFLQLPCSIEQFMFQIRTEIVDAGARFFSSDVHDHNKIFLWAKSIFGVNVPNEHDPFQNINLSLDLEAVHLFLSEKFDLHYQPLQLLSRVEQKLMDICHNQFAYDGFQRNGYDLTVYTRILNYFIQIFQDQKLSTLDCFMFDSDETKIQDIDWSKIKRTFLCI